MWHRNSKAYIFLMKKYNTNVLETVTLFKYLGRMLMAGDNDWMEVADNLINDRKSWVRMMSILRWEGADPKVLRLFFKAVVQAVLILGAETWVLTPWMDWSLRSF